MDRPQHLIADPAGVERLAASIERAPRIALDTESNGFHAYFEKVCLVQISTPEADWALDVLAVQPAKVLELLRDPARELVLHAAEYDVLCMKRDYGIEFTRIFDTHAAAKVLGIERVGLHNLLADQLGVQLDVDEQRSDWGKRPLSAAQLEYAFADVRWLLPLREKLGEQLEAKKLVREAEAEFARLVAKEPRPREFDPEGWQRMKAARTLDGRGRGILRELYLLRDQRARDLDRPPFKVLSDLFLAEVARRQPKTADELARIPGASAGAVRKLGADVLEAARKGAAGPALGRPKQASNSHRRAGGPPPPEVEDRYEKLRAWRKARAEARKVEVQVIAPNAVLWGIARADPADLAQLASVDGMDVFRVEQYGAEILDALKRP